MCKKKKVQKQQTSLYPRVSGNSNRTAAFPCHSTNIPNEKNTINKYYVDRARCIFIANFQIVYSLLQHAIAVYVIHKYKANAMWCECGWTLRWCWEKKLFISAIYIKFFLFTFLLQYFFLSLKYTYRYRMCINK